ncbi:MAG: class I SAM-dependent methyltransferase [Bdellovibrionales bacterium]|nr:class I SAM-dependent methyltransferase [Bdellovibrionales bacterium]
MYTAGTHSIFRFLFRFYPMVVLLLAALPGSGMAESTTGVPSPDLATFEAITGESPEEDHSAWDRFYKKKNHAFGKEAIGFLKENIKILPKGRAFVPAMGEGRNAIFLARHGFRVEGVDLSQVAVDRALQEAKAKKTFIKGIVGDLFEFPYPKEAYDFILVSLFYSERLLPKLKNALKKGGYIMIYLKRDTGRQSTSLVPDDFAVKAGALKAALVDFETLIYREFIEQNMDMIAILARKK